MIVIPRLVLYCLLPRDVRRAILAELDAEYAGRIRPSRGPARAAAWYWRQAIGSTAPALGMRVRRLARLAADARQDLRYASRLLARQKAFTAAAVATLALGIGANTAIFTVVDVLLLRPLPYRDPSRLVRVWSANPRGIPRNAVSPADYFDWREQAAGFDSLAAFVSYDVTLTGAGEPARLTAADATANLAETLGATPLAGRWLTADEMRGAGLDVAVVGESLWRERFGSAPDIVGRSIVIDGRPRTIVGVMPRTFRFPAADDRLWTPLGDGSRSESRSAHYLGVVGRLAPCVTVDGAREGLRAVARRLETAYPDSNRGWAVTVTSLRDSLVGDVRTRLLVLLGAVAAVLLIACANVASLMLARGVARARELGVRAAMGATRGRLLRQQTIEGLLLSLLGGAAGVALAAWSLQVLRKTSGVDLPMLERVSLDARVLAWVATVTFACGILTALVPGWKASRLEAGAALHGSARATGRSIRTRQAIVLAQVAVATALVIGGVLLIRSYDRLSRVPIGFNAGATLLADVSLPSARYPRAARAPFFSRALQDIRALPGVVAAGAGGPLPLSGQDGLLRFGIQIEGRDPAEARANRAYLRWATPGYLEAMGIALRSGRLFRDGDTADAAPVAVIDEVLQRRYFGGVDPIGKRVKLSNDGWREVVGVVDAVHQSALDRDRDPHFYVPEAQYPSFALTVVIRTRGEPAAMTPSVRAVVQRLDPQLPLSGVRTLEDVVAGATAPRRFNAWLLSLFAAVAAALTLIGVYGVVSQVVAQSTREMGVRIALGATRGDIVSLVVGRALRTSMAGIACGWLLAWAIVPALRGMLFGLAPRDPATFVVVACALVAAAAAAAYIPARRIMRLDVLAALRVD
jgi:putative ABC transport system permease protein